MRVAGEDRHQAPDGEDPYPVYSIAIRIHWVQAVLDPDIGDHGGEHDRDEADDRLAGTAGGAGKQRHHVRADGQGDQNYPDYVGEDDDPARGEP